MRRTLRYRVPNPPPAFIGRAAELAWIEARLADGPLVVIAGPSGLGKTALALRALHCASERAVFVAIRPGDPAESVLRHLLWGLGELAGRSVDAVPLAQIPED